MAFGILYSSLTTTKYINQLSRWSGRVSLLDILKEISIALSNRFFNLFLLVI